MATRFLCIGLFFSATLSAQFKEVDSVLTVDEFIQWVDQNHPLLKAVGNKLPISGLLHKNFTNVRNTNINKFW